MADASPHPGGGPQYSADALPGRRRKVPRGCWVAAGFTGVLAVAAVLIWVGARAANNSEGVGLEAAKAGFQLLVLAAAGVGITGALEWFSRQQDERRRTNDAAVELLRDLIDNYNKLKGTRRVLRALGLQDPPPVSAMSLWQREAFEREMRTLLEVQLAFERVGREIGVRLEEDETPRGTTPQKLLAGMESYVKHIVQEWEDRGAKAASSNDDLAANKTGVPYLKAFLEHSGDDPDGEFRMQMSKPLRELKRFFRRRLVVPISLADESDSDVLG